MKPSRKSKPAIAWLRTEPGFARLGEQASRLAALQVDLQRCMPGLGLDVIALERDTLVVGAAHAAVAAKVPQVTPTLRKMIHARKDEADIKAEAQRDGMLTLRESAIKKMLLGETTYEEVIAVTTV